MSLKSIDNVTAICYSRDMLDKIIEYQKLQGLSNQAFADRIGYNRTSWIRVKTGRAPLNDKLLQRIEAAFPDIFLPLKTATVVDSGNAPHPAPTAKRSWGRRMVNRLLIKLYNKLCVEPDGRED
jgi:hypothetical protein